MNQQTRESPIAIIGPGAVGSTVAYCTKGLAHHVFFNRTGAIAKKIRYATVKETVSFETATPTIEEINNIEICFFAVKAYDLKEAINQHLPTLPKNCILIPLSNGAIELILKEAKNIFTNFIWRLGFTTFGITQLSTDCYALKSDSGKIFWGPLNSKEALLTRVEKKMLSLPSLSWEANIIYLHRRKWLFNTVMNSLCAAKNLSQNQDLLKLDSELEAVFEESFNLGERLWGPWQKTAKALKSELIVFIQETGSNENSMKRDLRLGNKTESQFLAGLALDFEGFARLKHLHQSIINKQSS